MMKKRLMGTWIAPGVHVPWTPKSLRNSLLKVVNTHHTDAIGLQSGHKMHLFLPEKRFKRITLGEVNIGVKPQRGRGLTLEVGGIMGTEGTMDLVRNVNRSKEVCFSVFFEIPEGVSKNMDKRLADLLHAAEEIAKKSGVEHLNLDVYCDKEGKPLKTYVEQACESLSWSQFQTVHPPKGKHGKSWTRFGIYLAKHKKAPKARKGNSA